MEKVERPGSVFPTWRILRNGDYFALLDLQWLRTGQIHRAKLLTHAAQSRGWLTTRFYRDLELHWIP